MTTNRADFQRLKRAAEKIRTTSERPRVVIWPAGADKPEVEPYNGLTVYVRRFGRTDQEKAEALIKQLKDAGVPESEIEEALNG